MKQGSEIIRRSMDLALCCNKIADQVVPRYKQKPYPDCAGKIAKRWQAAWDGACVALGGDPEEYRR